MLSSLWEWYLCCTPFIDFRRTSTFLWLWFWEHWQFTQKHCKHEKQRGKHAFLSSSPPTTLSPDSAAKLGCTMTPTDLPKRLSNCNISRRSSILGNLGFLYTRIIAHSRSPRTCVRPYNRCCKRDLPSAWDSQSSPVGEVCYIHRIIRSTSHHTQSSQYPGWAAPSKLLSCIQRPGDNPRASRVEMLQKCFVQHLLQILRSAQLDLSSEILLVDWLEILLARQTCENWLNKKAHKGEKLDLHFRMLITLSRRWRTESRISEFYSLLYLRNTCTAGYGLMEIEWLWNLRCWMEGEDVLNIYPIQRNGEPIPPVKHNDTIP